MVTAAMTDAQTGGDETLRRLLERRESLLRVSPLIACIGGARFHSTPAGSPVQPYGRRHLEIAEVLLQAVTTT